MGLFFLMGWFAACQETESSFPYLMTKPNRTIRLAQNLKEVSGLTAIDQEHIAVIQDEKGNIYRLNLIDEKVEHKTDFARDGDYEGVEVVENTAWVVNSSGTLFQIENPFSDSAVTRVFKTFLKKEDNIEGLTYQKSKNRLLLASKGESGKGKVNSRAIFAFDLEKNELSSSPAYLIFNQKIDSLFGQRRNENSKGNGSASRINFRPSGIAIHPFTDQIYILSAEAHCLIILNPDGQLADAVHLKKSLFKQPEGICFLPDGSLVISNEGDKKKGNILVFFPKN